MLYENEEYYATRYDGYYVSRNGSILSTRTKKPHILIPKIDKYGYERYLFSICGVNHYVQGHRIVAQTFLDNPENKPTVNHIDGNKRNNHVENLEWATYSENNQHRFDHHLAEPPGKWAIDVYRDGEKIYNSLGVCEFCEIFTRRYFEYLANDKILTRMIVFERNNSKIKAYWNGKTIGEYDSAKEVEKEFGIRRNHVYERLNGKRTRKTDDLIKNYQVVIKSRGNEKCNDYRKTS